MIVDFAHVGLARAAPHEHIGLSAIHVPALHEVVDARVSDLAASMIDVALEFEVSRPQRQEILRRVEHLCFFHGAPAVLRHHRRAVRKRDWLGERERAAEKQHRGRSRATNPFHESSRRKSTSPYTRQWARDRSRRSGDGWRLQWWIEHAPSGQHGQWPESAAIPDMSIMPWQGEVSACELPANALANGAAENNCAA